MTEKKILSRIQAEKLVSDDLTNMSGNYLMCRDLRHSWKVDADYEASEVETSEGKPRTIYTRVLICRSCHTTRTDTSMVVSHRGSGVPRLERVSVRYGYPKNYQMKRGNLPRDIGVGDLVRYETLRRVLGDARKS